jgi:hypothetical protein
MCIISLPVLKVDSTNIFIGISDDYLSQITIYSNKVHNTSSNNAMILPVPCSNVKFFEVDSNFFDKLDKCFEMNVKSFAKYRSASLSDKITPNSVLPVISVGSYLVSVAPTLEDLKRVDNIFTLSPDCAEALKDYPNHFGFIVCKLENKEKKYHPLGYSFSINQKLFIPTKHYHGTQTKDIEYFDHNIYTWGCSSEECHQYSTIYKETESPDCKEIYRHKTKNKLPYHLVQKELKNLKIPKEIKLCDTNDIFKYNIHGFYPNKDFYAEFDTTKVPTKT